MRLRWGRNGVSQTEQLEIAAGDMPPPCARELMRCTQHCACRDKYAAQPGVASRAAKEKLCQYKCLKPCAVN